MCSRGAGQTIVDPERNPPLRTVVAIVISDESRCPTSDLWQRSIHGAMGEALTTEEVMVGIREIFAAELEVDVPDGDVHLIQEGYLDSMDVVRLLAAMSDRFGVAIELKDLEVADLGTVASLAGVVVRRR